LNSTIYTRQLSSSSGGCGFGGGPASLSSSRSESPASERFSGKCSSLLALHLRNIDSELENLAGLATDRNTNEAEDKPDNLSIRCQCYKTFFPFRHWQ
jgi:hypothetical protein